MKTPGLVLLLLWADLDVVTGKSKDLKDGTTGNSDTQQPCQPDIQSVLREMSDLIAEQRVELRYSRTLIEGLERKAEAMETRLETTEREVEELRSDNEAYATTLNLTEAKVEELRREREKSMVSFSTSLTISGVSNLGPNPTAVPLVFKHVITNIGNAYNPHSGFFTAPVRGVYHFVIFAVGFGHESRFTAVYLQKNGQQVVIASGQQPDARVETSNAASLLLEVGDVVNVNLYPQAWVHDSYNHHTTFSGHLLFPM